MKDESCVGQANAVMTMKDKIPLDGWKDGEVRGRSNLRKVYVTYYSSLHMYWQ
jgi:hypothetical protein